MKEIQGKSILVKVSEGSSYRESTVTGAPNENIIQNHLNIALLNVF